MVRKKSFALTQEIYHIDRLFLLSSKFILLQNTFIGALYYLNSFCYLKGIGG